MGLQEKTAAEAIHAGKSACIGPDGRVYEAFGIRTTFIGADGLAYAWPSYPCDPRPRLTAIRDIVEGETIWIDTETGEVGKESEHAILPVEFREGESWRDRSPLL